ncbi:hypothetical protein J7T55_011005 [Diaporthe amygdali]|uniref:uncharacterized protein n=1 Tax=Phomopsis amygdali TaxID=1214568 RepID=UPI0022FEB930|nr:uncharacterized protein J7T55_011005 [Diaporthe amygdali]KAJ0103735.1 hypothetical protein J7T55_011005 [Diaporthe amygdali]
MIGFVVFSDQEYTLASLSPRVDTTGRDRIRLRDGWKFQLSSKVPDGVTYDIRPDNDGQNLEVLKSWILPSANDFIPSDDDHYKPPSGQPETKIPYVSPLFDDSGWMDVKVPHDWAITESFVSRSVTSGDMARLKVQGVGWYRRQLDVSSSDESKLIYLEIDGAMSYAMVWLNGQLIGGWPYGYNSFRIDLTPYIDLKGNNNSLAIRVENPQDDSFSRWYPGAGIYRNVWLVKIDSRIHIAQYGTTFVSSEVSTKSATLDLSVRVNKATNGTSDITVVTEVHNFDSPSGIRTIKFGANNGLEVNGQKVYIQGVNQHHDLGALGTAFNIRAATRQLEILRELGVNTIRLSHIPPAPELLRLTDEFGFLVINEIFDNWAEGKRDSDFNLI